jgi:hypothetical protein
MRVRCFCFASAAYLEGLTWIALKPKPPNKVVLNGADSGGGFVDPALPPAAAEELRWCWDALRTSTACGAVAVFYRGRRVMQAGMVPKSALKSGRVAAPLARLLHRIQTT